MKAPLIIAIAGASCSGKTTVARELARALGNDSTTILGMDSYYFDLSHLPPEQVHTQNLDEPEALEHTLLIEHVAALARGDAIEKPVYDHRGHTRVDPETIEPGSFIIVEGLFALYWEELRRHTQTKVFIDTTHDLCLSRRITRDRNQRGRSREEVTHRYQTMVAPMFDRHAWPTREHADLIVNGAGPIDESTAAILLRVGVGAGGARAGDDTTGCGAEDGGGDSGGGDGGAP